MVPVWVFENSSGTCTVPQFVSQNGIHAIQFKSYESKRIYVLKSVLCCFEVLTSQPRYKVFSHGIRLDEFPDKLLIVYHISLIHVFSKWDK